MPIRRLLATTFLLSCALSANAQNLKPGLWEISHKTQFGGGGMDKEMAAMQKEMANMPPDQRKMMEDMMAKQGVTMGTSGGPGAMSIKMCMTKEMVERNDMPAGQGDCTSTNSPRVGNTMKIAFTCTKPPSSGEGQITFTSPEAYAMKMTVNTGVKGKPEKMDMEGAGKWLGADCGSVKPVTLPKK